MGQVVQEAEPVFSGAHEGLCLCTSRLLFPLWELPVFVTRGGLGSSDVTSESGVVTCRLSVGALQILENKVRSLEKFLRSRRNQRRGLYGCVAGLGDVTGSILYGTGSDLGSGDRNMVRNLFGAHSRNIESTAGVTASKRQRLPYSPAELAAMEVGTSHLIYSHIALFVIFLFLRKQSLCYRSEQWSVSGSCFLDLVKHCFFYSLFRSITWHAWFRGLMQIYYKHWFN